MIKLPEADGTLSAYRPSQTASTFVPNSDPFRSRSILATAHVLGDPLADNEPFGPPGGPPPPQKLDWEASMAFRRELWSYGFTLCEGLETAHRGMGLEWPGAKELIERSGAEARAVGGRMAAVVLTDQLEPYNTYTLAEVQAAYEEQMEVVEQAGGMPVIMCSPNLNVAVRSPEDFATVYGNLLRQSSGPAVLHWITSEWDPRNSEYWGHEEMDDAYDALLDIVRQNRDKVDGVKIGPAPLARQVEWTKRLPEGVRFYTSDTDEYPEMYVGYDGRHSDALTPVVDPVLPIAAQAFRAIDDDDPGTARKLLDSTLPLVQHLFSGESRSIFFFKTGVVFLGWLSGHSSHYRMVWGEQSARSVPHLAKAYRLADELGLFADPALAEQRMKLFLTTSGIEQ